MEILRQKVRKLLTRGFPRGKIARLEASENGISGLLVTSQFYGVEVGERLKMIDVALERGLTSDEMKQIVLILAMTPAEHRYQTSST